MSVSPKRYNKVAITLHWVMALAFLTMIIMGLAMVNLPLDKSLQFRMYQWHKSLGVLLIVAAFLRLMVRIISSIPDFPQSMNRLQRIFAKAGHWALYLWMFILPISGWIMVSASILSIPTIVFGWFEWPHFPYIHPDVVIEDLAKKSHQLLAYGFIGLILGHIAFTFKHLLIDKENLLPRMGIGHTEKD